MRARRTTALAASLAVLALTVAGCSQPAEEVPSEPSATPTASVTPEPAEPSASPTPTPEAADPQADWQRVATPNGTATFAIPPGWTAESAGKEVEYDGELHWQNIIDVLDPSGSVQLSYWDGPFDDVGAATSFGVVAGERVETLDDAERAAALRDVFDPKYLDHAAVAWWTNGVPPEIIAVVSLTSAHHLSGDSHPEYMVGDSQRSISFGTRRPMGSEAEAEAWLAGEEAARLLEIIGTLDLTAVPAPVLPAG